MTDRGNETDAIPPAVTRETEGDSGSGQGAKVSFLDQALWRQIEDDTDAFSFYSAWLALQCRRASKVDGGVLYLCTDGKDLSAAAAWPQASAQNPRLDNAARLALEQGKPVLKAAANDAQSSAGTASLAVPIVDAGAVIAVIAATQKADADPKDNIRALQWGNAWIRHKLAADHVRLSQKERHRSGQALALFAAMTQESGFSPTATVLVTELAMELNCDRVSLGMRRGRRSVLKAISHSASFAERMDLVRSLEAAMDEAIDQDVAIMAPQPGGDPLTIRAAHEDVILRARGGHAVTVPLIEDGGAIGALTFERASGLPFTADDLKFADAVAAVAAPIIGSRYRDQQWIGTKLLRKAKEETQAVIGPRNYGKKLALLALFGITAFSLFATGEHVVAASASLEGSVKRIVAAPIDGYVASSFYRAGDEVEEGDILASLDDRDLTLELQNWETVRRQRQRESDRAMAERDPAELRIIEAQLAQAAAQVALLEARLARTTLKAPFDGLIVSGDLSQSIGAAVSRGDVLFELTPAGGYRVLLSVPETELDDVFPGQTGRIVLTAFPGQAIPFAVERVTPVAEVDDGRNVFLAEAVLGETDLPLRPGMQGIGKVEIGERRLLWIWTHEMGEFLRLSLWRLWG